MGVNYGGRLFGTVNNKNSIGVEMCVQAGYDLNKAFANTVEFVRQLMAETGIPADRVVQHYDVCAKNCPSQIRKKGLWEEFKKQIGNLDDVKDNNGSDKSSGSSQKIKPLSGYVKIFYKGKDGLNIRKAPCLGDNVAETVFEGTYTVIGISEDGNWYQLKSGCLSLQAGNLCSSLKRYRLPTIWSRFLFPIFGSVKGREQIMGFSQALQAKEYLPW